MDLIMFPKTNWNNRYMELAQHIAGWSKQDVKVGCVIVNAEDNRVISTGFNDRPKFLDGIHLPHKLGICHAEVNALVGLKAILTLPVTVECKVYVTKPPCRECAEFLWHNLNLKEIITVPADANSSWLTSQCHAEEFLEGNNVVWTVHK